MFPNVCITSSENELVLREPSPHQRVHHTTGAALLSHTEHTVRGCDSTVNPRFSQDTLQIFTCHGDENTRDEQKTELIL